MGTNGPDEVNLTEAAARLGVSRTRVQSLLAQHKLTARQDPLDRRGQLVPVEQINRLLNERNGRSLSNGTAYAEDDHPADDSDERPPVRIVVLAGGTSLYNTLFGLARLRTGVSVTAIVTPFQHWRTPDQHRDDNPVPLPSNDFITALLALSSDAGDGSLVRRILQDRGQLQDPPSRSLADRYMDMVIRDSGSLSAALKYLGEQVFCLDLRDRVLSLTKDLAILCADTPSGPVCGQDGSEAVQGPIDKVYVEELPDTNSEAADAIRDAHLVVMGPGYLYTGIIPPLLARGVPQVIQASSGAKAFICNIWNRGGDTIWDGASGFTASKFLSVTASYMGYQDDDLDLGPYSPKPFDYAILAAWHRGDPGVAEVILERYHHFGAREVPRDPMACHRYARTIIEKDLITKGKTVIQYDPDKLALELVALAQEQRETLEPKAASPSPATAVAGAMRSHINDPAPAS